MISPSNWWSKPLDPYANNRIYLSDGGSTYSWAFTGDPSMIVSYEEWKLIPKPEYTIKPLPFIMSNADERNSQAMDKHNDKLIHGL